MALTTRRVASQAWWLALVLLFSACGVYPKVARERWTEYRCPPSVVEQAAKRITLARHDSIRLRLPIGSDRCVALLALGLPSERIFLRADNVRDPTVEIWRYRRGISLHFASGLLTDIIERPDRSPTAARKHER